MNKARKIAIERFCKGKGLKEAINSCYTLEELSALLSSFDIRYDDAEDVFIKASLEAEEYSRKAEEARERSIEFGGISLEKFKEARKNYLEELKRKAMGIFFLNNGE